MVDPRKKIEQLRLKNNWTRSKLARELGISETSVYNWYNEKNSMPTVKTLIEVSSLFDIPTVELFTDVESANLSGQQISLLEQFNRLTEKQQKIIIDLIKIFIE